MKHIKSTSKIRRAEVPEIPIVSDIFCTFFRDKGKCDTVSA